MEDYIILREYAKQRNISVGEALNMGREKGILKTINEGGKANIYVCIKKMARKEKKNGR